MKIEFSSKRREMFLFLTTDMAAVTHAQTSNKGGELINGLKNAFQNKQHSSDGKIRLQFTDF